MRAAGKPGTGAKGGKAPANKSRTGAPKKPKLGLIKTKNIKKGLKMVKKGQKPSPKKVDTKKSSAAAASPQSPSKSKKAEGKVKDEPADQGKWDGSPAPKGRSSTPRGSPKKSRDQSLGVAVSAKAGKTANSKSAVTKISPKKQKPTSSHATKSMSVTAKTKPPKDNSKKHVTEKCQKTNSDASQDSYKTLPPKKRKTLVCEGVGVVKKSTTDGKESTFAGKESTAVGRESTAVDKESTAVDKDSPTVDKDSPTVDKDSSTVVAKLSPVKPELMDTAAIESPSAPGPKKAVKNQEGDSSINPKKRGRPKGSKNKLKSSDDKELLKGNPLKNKVVKDKKVKPSAKQKAKVSKSVPKVKDKSYIDESSIIPESETKVKRLAAILSSEVDHYTYNTDDGSSEYEEYAYSRKSIKKKTTSKADPSSETKGEKSGGKYGKAEKSEVTASSGWETLSDADNNCTKKTPVKTSRDSEGNSNVRNAIDRVLSKMKVEHMDQPSEIESSTMLPKISTTKTSSSHVLTPVKTSRSNEVKKMKEDSCADDEESDYDSGFSLKKERSATSKKSESTVTKSGQSKRKLPQKGSSAARSQSCKAVSFASDEEEESHKESESEEESTTEKKKRLKTVSKSKNARSHPSKAVDRPPSPLRRTARMASLNARAVMHCMNEDARMHFHSPRAEAKKTPPPPAQDMALVLRAESTIAKRHTDDDSDDESEEESVHIRRFSGKRKKDTSGSSSMGGKVKKVRKKRRGELDIQMDMRDMVVTKRMASLNASAIMAASYCVESRRRTPCHAASSSAESEVTNLDIKRKISYKSTKSKGSKSRSVITVQETTKKLKKAEGTRETEVEERIIVKKKVKRHSSGRSNTHDDTDKDDDYDNATDVSEINHDEIIPKSPEDGGMIVESTITYITTQTDTSPQTVSLSGGVSSYSISSGDRKTMTVVQQVERKSKTTTKCTAYSTGAPPTAFIPPTHYVQPVLHSSPPLMGSGSLKPPVSYSPLGALSGMQPTAADLHQPSPPTTSSPALINTNRQLQPSFPAHHQHHYHHHIHAPTIHHHHHPAGSPSNPPQPPSNAQGGGYHHQQPPPNYHHHQQPQQQQNHRPSPPSPVGTPQHQQQYLQPHSPPYPPPPLPSPASGRPPPMLMAGGSASGSGYQMPPLQQQDQQLMQQQQQLSPQKLVQHPYHYSHLQQQQHTQQNFIPNSQQQHQMLHHHQQLHQLQQHPMLAAAPPSLKQQQQQKQLGNARPAVSSPCSVPGAMSSTASPSSSSMTNNSVITAQQQQHYMQQQHQLNAQTQQQLIHPMRQQKQQQQQLSYPPNQADSMVLQQVPHGGGPLMGPDSGHPSQGPASYHHRQGTTNYHTNNTQAQNHCGGGSTPNNQMVISNSNNNSFNQMGGNSSNSGSRHCSNLLSNSTPSPGGGGSATNSNSSSPLPRSSPQMLRGPQESPKALLPPPPGPDCSGSERHQSAFTAPAVSAVAGYQPVSGPIPVNPAAAAPFKTPQHSPGSTTSPAAGSPSGPYSSTPTFPNPPYSSSSFTASCFSSPTSTTYTSSFTSPTLSPSLPSTGGPSLLPHLSPPSKSSSVASSLSPYPSSGEPYPSSPYSYPPYQGQSGYPPPQSTFNKYYQSSPRGGSSYDHYNTGGFGAPGGGQGYSYPSPQYMPDGYPLSSAPLSPHSPSQPPPSSQTCQPGPSSSSSSPSPPSLNKNTLALPPPLTHPSATTSSNPPGPSGTGPPPPFPAYSPQYPDYSPPGYTGPPPPPPAAAAPAPAGSGFCCGTTTDATKRPIEAFTDRGPFNNSQQHNKQMQKKLLQNDQHFQRNCSPQQQQQQQIQQQNAQKQMQLMQYQQQQQQQQIKYQQLMKQQQHHMQQQQEQSHQKHPPLLSPTKQQSNNAPFMASKTKEVISLDGARSPSIPPSPGLQQSPAVDRPQQQSPDSSGRVISCSNSSSSSSSSVSPGARGEVSSVGTNAWPHQSSKRRGSGVVPVSSGTEPIDGVSSDSSIAATIANLLKLNSCTITSAAAPVSTPRRDVSSPTPSPPFSSTSCSDRSAPSGVHSKASPQVPSINSTTTNVPVSPDKEISSTNKLSNSNSTSNNFFNNTSSRNTTASCNSINNNTGGTMPLVQNRNKSLVGSSTSLTQNFGSSVSVKSKVSSEPSKAGNSHISQIPARTNNLKNTEDIRRSIASALPHLSASMVLKEVEAPPRHATDVSRDVEKDQQTQPDDSFSNSATPVNATSSRPMESEEDSLTICLPSSGSIRTSSSPCLAFATNDATDLSVANDLLLLSQSDLQFPLQTTNMGGLSAAVSSTSSGGEREVPLLPACAVGEDHQAIRPPSPSKGSHSSSATSSSVDRSNSNSPNSRFGSRHLLCQIVPAHSQSKTATARAKPQGLTGQKSSVKAEIKESSPDPSLNNLSCSAERNASQDSSIRDRNGDNKESSDLLNHKLETASASTGRKRGRPPKAKEKSSTESASSSPVLSNDLTVRADSKNGRGIGETVTPLPTHQYKLKNNEEKLTLSKKLSLSSKADLKDSKLSFSCLDSKKSLQVKTESVPKIKSEKVSPNSAYSVDSPTKVSSTSFKLVNGDSVNPANCLSSLDDVDKLADALSCHKLSRTKSQIPTCEELKYVLTEHSKQEGNKLKPGTSKKSGDDSKASKSDSSSSREGSNPPNKSTKLLKQAQKGSSCKPSKTGKNIAVKKPSECSKWRCKKSLLAYLKEKNENDTSNVDSDVPSGSGPDALPGASSAGAEGGDPLRPGGEGSTKAAGPGAFPSYPLKALRRRTSSGSSKGKAVKKPKWIHGWSWEGEPYQGKIWLRNDEAVVGRTCYPAMQHREGDLVRVRDCVLLRSGPRKVDLPFVAKVAALWEDPDSGDMMMSILWYYRPEHTESGRQEHDLVDEIFASKHRDHLSVACIEDTCYVLTFNEYCRYRRQLRQTLQGLPPQQVVSVVPDAEAEYPRQQRQPPGCVVPDLLFFCRRVYDYRQKRLLKNPC